DEPRRTVLLDPFVDSGRAVAVRRTGKNIVLRGLLQRHVLDPEMDRLVLLMVGVGQEYRRQLVEGQLAVGLYGRHWRVALGRLQRCAIGSTVADGAKQRESKQRVHPHVEATEPDGDHGPELRPERLDVADLEQVLADR